MIKKEKIAVIIGAGPAGLTAAYELLDKTDIKPVIFEATNYIGGISKTIEYKGNKIDIGGHRFFSKSERIMEWWQNILPLQGAPSVDDKELERKFSFPEKYFKKVLRSKEVFNCLSPDPEKDNEVMLIRNRLSRIFFLKRFFDYPISLSYRTFSNLGIKRAIEISISYLKSLFFKREEKISI